MSIAVEESHNLVNETTMASFHHSDNQVSFWDSLLMSQGAYIAGRTAEPTEAEIKAAARSIWIDEHRSAFPTRTMLEEQMALLFSIDNVAVMYEMRAVRALDAARKAVTGR